MTTADNMDFHRFAEMDKVWVRSQLRHFGIDVCITGKLEPDFFSGEPAFGELEITIYYQGYDDAVFCCSYSPDGLECIHVSTLFLAAYGYENAVQSDNSMGYFMDTLICDLKEHGVFDEAMCKQ